jgi:hypothetical protein
MKTKELFTLSVNYNLPLSGLVAAGKYSWVNDNITQKNFGKPDNDNTGEVELETQIFNFGKSVSSETAVARMANAGFRPANHFELAAFGAQHPKVQREKSIVALGSSWIVPDGGALVAYLDGISSHRYLNLDYWGGGWRSNYWFLGVRQESSK